MKRQIKACIQISAYASAGGINKVFRLILPFVCKDDIPYFGAIYIYIYCLASQFKVNPHLTKQKT